MPQNLKKSFTYFVASKLSGIFFSKIFGFLRIFELYCISMYIIKLKNRLVKAQVRKEQYFFRKGLISFCQVEIGLSEVNCLEWLRRLEREI